MESYLLSFIKYNIKKKVNNKMKNKIFLKIEEKNIQKSKMNLVTMLILSCYI